MAVMYDAVVARNIAQKAYAELVKQIPAITDDFRVMDDMTVYDLIRDNEATFKASGVEGLAEMELTPEVVQATMDVIRENHGYKS